MVAHNAKFDIEMIRREGVEVKSFICTLAVAQNLLADAGIKSFKLQMLRYHFGIELVDSKAHDAQGDVEVLEKVFEHLYNIARDKASKWAKENNKPAWTKQQILERMIEMSMSPIQTALVMPFGKYQGIKLIDMVKTDRRYCEWLVGKSENPNDNVISTLHYLLNKKA